MENQTWSDACLSVGLLTKGVTVLSTHCPLCRTHRQPILWMITTQRLYYLPRIESGGDLHQISTPCFWCDFKDVDVVRTAECLVWAPCIMRRWGVIIKCEIHAGCGFRKYCWKLYSLLWQKSKCRFRPEEVQILFFEGGYCDSGSSRQM